MDSAHDSWYNWVHPPQGPTGRSGHTWTPGPSLAWRLGYKSWTGLCNGRPAPHFKFVSTFPMIPEEFVRVFLWERDPTIPNTTYFPFCNDVRLPSAILSELNSLVSLAFSNVEKACASTTETFLDTPLQRKCAVISCTQSQGTQVIDAAVGHVARKQDADVLILDALELACGKFGWLGPGTSIRLYTHSGSWVLIVHHTDGELIDKLYRRYEGSPPAEDKPFLDRDTLQFLKILSPFR